VVWSWGREARGSWLARLVTAVMAAALAVLGVAVPAYAAGSPDIAKALDATQGAGYTAPSTFAVGALVRYRLTLTCSSNTTDCGASTMSDVLNSGLTPVQVVLPTASTDGTPLSFPLSQSISGQTMTVTLGSAAKPWPDGNSLEVVVVAKVNGTVTGTIPNSATLEASGGTVTSPIVDITVPKPTPNWLLQKGATPSQIAPGETVKYGIRFANPNTLGNVVVTGGTLVDTFPAGVVVLKNGVAIPDGGTTAEGGVVDYTSHTITWTVPRLDPTNANCGTSPCVNTSWYPAQVEMKFPAELFAAGTTQTNSVTSTVNYADGTTGTLTAKADVKIVAPSYNPGFSKGGPSALVPGESFVYAMRATNNGNATGSNWTVTDRLPTGLSGLTLTRVYGPIWNNSTGVPDSVVTYEWSADGTTWTTFFTYNPGGAFPDTPVPTSARFVRATAASMAPNAWFDIHFKATAASDLTPGATLQNCAQLTGTGVPAPVNSCTTATVQAPYTTLRMSKGHIFVNDPGATSMAPGDTFGYWLAFSRENGSPLVNTDLVDVLPKAFEYVSTGTFYTAPPGSPRFGVYGTVSDTTTGNALTPTITNNADGTQTLLWPKLTLPASVQDGTVAYGVYFTVRVRPGAAVANYTNNAQVNNTVTSMTKCLWTSATDTKDLNANGSTTETVCSAADVVQVRDAARADVLKWVKGDVGLNALETTGLPSSTCPDLNGYTRYPCVSQVTRGGKFDYLFEHVNTGNVPLTNFVMYDILPHVGDVGVNQVLATSTRGTKWDPVMTGPVTFDASTVPAGASPQVMYSLSYDPCRPELAQGAPGTNWQGAACDSPEGGTNAQNTWYTADQITDWSTVKSFKVKLFQGVKDTASGWQPAATITAHVPMKAPVSASESSLSPLNLSVAWNSMAHQEARLNSDGTTAPLLSAAPRKVGVIVPFPGVSVGDYVWVDANRDGLQSPGEPGLPGVTVNLKDASGASVQSTTTDKNGYYSFRFLLPGAQYTIEFVAPSGATFTTVNAGGVTSNDPVADNGATPLDGTTGGDSDAVVATDGKTGSVTFTSPSMGGSQNLASDPGAGTVADNPGIDAGFITSMNLQLKKSLDSAGPFSRGQSVTYTLTPNNEGPMGALKGWSVTDLAPAGMTITKMVGTGYTCTIATGGASGTCSSGVALPAGKTAAPVTVTATINADAPLGGTLKNVAYVAPATGDIVETNALVVPTLDTVTKDSPTDNDAEASLTLSNAVSIGDFVWFDTNRNGVQDKGEPVVSGVVVNLYAADGTTKVASTTTDSAGFYSFTDLTPSTAYVVEFVKPTGTSFTTQTTGSDKGVDSNPDLATGRATVTTPASGANSATSPDDPSIDAGLVKYNLTLAKALTTTGTVNPGGTVTYALTPHNEGPVDALAGWSVTDILPAGLTLVSMTGTGYTCSGGTCTAGAVLAAGADGPVITVTAKLDSSVTSGSLKNVAYVAPVSTDGPETNPLVVPTLATVTKDSATDNDAEASVTVTPLVSIGDFVWYDVNRDGVQNNNEPVYAGMTVQLLDGQGKVVKSTTTDSAGYYVFADLPPNTAYTVKFVAGTAETFTTQAAGTNRTLDSNPDPATGLAAVTTPADGKNRTGQGLADDPSIDAGVVKYNLTLGKVLTTTGTINPGATVTFSLTPHNDGPVDALAGWSVTDVLPAGLSLVSMTGTGYTCAGATCTAGAPLAAKADGPVITVTAKLDPSITTGSVKNVAYVAPATGDVAESNPLVVPTTTTDTSATGTDNDAQAVVSVTALVSVGDFVWYDVNRDGVQNNNEPVYAGMTVQLLDGKGVVVKSTTTDSSGYYVFSDLPPNTAYTVKFVLGDGESFTTQTAGTNTTLDSNPDPATGLAAVTTPADGKNRTGQGLADDPSIDAGVVKYNLKLAKELTSTGKVYAGSSVTFKLTPSNDGPVAALKGWSVTDVLPKGLTLVSMTGAGYTCSGAVCVAQDALAPGAAGGPITVTATVDAGFVGTANNVAYVAPVTGDVPETNPLVVPTSTTNTDITPTDNDAQAPVGVDSLVSVGDHVWWDINRDGVQGKGEAPVKDVPVTLYTADGVKVNATTTDANGFYSFTGLTPGKAYYEVFTKPVGTAFTTANAGADDTVDSDVNPANGRVDFVAPASGTNSPTSPDNPTLDAGLVQINLTLGKKLDTAGPFGAGDTVTFTLTPHNEGPVDALAGWSVTDLLPAGLTLVSITGDAAAYTCDTTTATCTALVTLGAGKDGALVTVTARIDAYTKGTLHNVAWVAPASGDAPESNLLVVPTTGTDTDKTGTDNDAQASLTLAPVSIGDFVWWDVNRDGLQTKGEPPVAGVTVTLFEADGKTKVASTVTDDKGFYSFTDLTPGQDYVVVFTKPDGTSFTTQTVGKDTTVDSNADVTTGTAPVHTPKSGANSATTPDDPTIDAGLVKINLTLAKKLDTAGPFGAGDTVTFTLTPHNDGPVDALKGWTVTDVLPKGLTLTSMTGDGAGYTCDTAAATCTGLSVLAAGKDGAPITVTATIDAYTTGTLHNVAWVAPVAGDTPESNLLVVPTTGTDTDTTGTDNDAQASLTLTPVSIGDFVWWDVNRDGLQTKGEAPVAGVTVTLYQADGTTKVASTVTDDKGFYSFTDLAPGQKYVVVFTKPDGTTFTTPVVGADKAIDSNPNTAGVAEVLTPKTGANSATTPDDPTIDAGLVKINLSLVKKLVTAGPFGAGDTVTFTLTPHNDGPVDALKGWSVSDVLPKRLTLVSITGDGAGYTCDNLAATCVSNQPLGAGKDGAPVTVTATIDAYQVGVLHNVAWVAPVAGDTPETNPLAVPTTTTDTDTSGTDNDAQASLELTPVSVGDHVWWDVNRDGLQSDGEPPVPGVTVTLYKADGTSVVATTVTDKDGFYSFKDLAPGQDYVIGFTRPDGTTFTTQTVGKDTTVDSNADITTGMALVHTPKTGTNSATAPDDPSIDAGLVKMNLTLLKALDKPGPYAPGDTVSFTLVPHNDGPVDALAGWSVTDVAPAGLTIVSMTGTGYTCDITTATCLSGDPLTAGNDGALITVTAKITATGSGTLRNVAYVAPVKGDTPETNPLGPVPPAGTDTSKTPTDNDSHVDLTYVTPPPLAYTGASGLGVFFGGGLLLTLIGVLTSWYARRREQESITT